MRGSPRVDRLHMKVTTKVRKNLNIVFVCFRFLLAVCAIRGPVHCAQKIFAPFLQNFEFHFGNFEILFPSCINY